MILIKVNRKGSLITDLEIAGHAGYAARGSDIVCASVSAIAQTALAGLDEIAKIQDSYKIEKTGRISLSIPEDISLISVDDTVIASALSPTLTSIIHPKEHLGKEAAKAILSMISGKSMWPYKKVFQPAIVIRESCREM